MEVMSLLLFIGAVFVLGAALAFLANARSGTFDHTERLALLPLDDPQDSPAAESRAGTGTQACRPNE